MQANCPSPTARYSGFINLQVGISEPSVGRGGACPSSCRYFFTLKKQQNCMIKMQSCLIFRISPLIHHPHLAAVLFSFRTQLWSHSFAARLADSSVLVYFSLDYSAVLCYNKCVGKKRIPIAEESRTFSHTEAESNNLTVMHLCVLRKSSPRKMIILL